MCVFVKEERQWGENNEKENGKVKKKVVYSNLPVQSDESTF